MGNLLFLNARQIFSEGLIFLTVVIYAFTAAILVTGLLPVAAAHAGMVELKISKEVDKNIDSIKKQGKKPTTVRDCAAAFHDRLAQIRGERMAELDAAYAAAKNQKSVMPGKMIFNAKRHSRKTSEGKLTRRAITNASIRGRRGVLSNDGLNWLTRQIVANLKTYLSQPLKPFMCTGSSAFLKFISPHIVKVADIGSPQKAPWEEYAEFANEELANAWRALPQLATPVWAVNRPAYTVAREVGSIIRPTIQSGNVGDQQESTVTSPTGIVDNDPDLPPMEYGTIPIHVDGPEDVRPIIKALIDRATNNGYLQPKTLETNSSKPDRETKKWPPDAILALIEAKKVLKASNFTPLQRRSPNPLISAFSKLEVFYYLFPDKNDRLVRLATAMQDILDAIDQASQETCTCNP